MTHREIMGNVMYPGMNILPKDRCGPPISIIEFHSMMSRVFHVRNRIDPRTVAMAVRNPRVWL